MKTQQELFDVLQVLGIEYKLYHHKPMLKACTDEQAQKLRLTIPGLYVKNLFLKDDKGKLWLIVMPEIRRVELKHVASLVKIKRFSFANSVLLSQYLGVLPGSVTPLGLINDVTRAVTVVIDRDCMNAELLNFHPLKNDETVSMITSDFEKFLHHCGNAVMIVDLFVASPCIEQK